MQLNFLWEVFQVRKPHICLLIFFWIVGEEENDWQKYEETAEIAREAQDAWPAKQQQIYQCLRSPEIVQWLSVLVILLEDPDPYAMPQSPVTIAPGDPIPSYGLYEHPLIWGRNDHMYTNMHTLMPYTFIHRNKHNFFKN